jgi:hypothetical protein
MFFVGTDFAESGGTFSANIKSDGAGRILAKVYATSGMLTKTGYLLNYQYTTSDNGWFQPMAAGSNYGLFGIASDAIASGCVGWVTIRGPVDNASSSATVQFTGSIGHAVFFTTASGMGASSSAYVAFPHQIGVLLEEATATYAVNICLTGNAYATGM